MNRKQRNPSSDPASCVFCRETGTKGKRVHICEGCAHLCKDIVDRAKGIMRCGFCGKSQQEVKKMVAGPLVCICDECIRLCSDIVEEDIEKEADGS